jgi:phosphoribosylformimino-5-aminoimidazole carboxamide ribotide isomerase
MDIIPAIDLIDGKCVRLTEGDYKQKTLYREDPLEVAREFEAAGLKRLHLVDLDGARARHIVNHRVLERIAAQTNLQIDFGGGLKTEEDLHIAFAAGAHQVTAGTIAVKQPELVVDWIQRFGSDRIILGADVRNGKVAHSGWQEASTQDLFEFLEFYTEKDIRYTICTDISRDGRLAGSATELYRRIRQQFPGLGLIASGGVTTEEELHALRKLGCQGAIIGKALYEGRLSLEALAQFNESNT